jgi:phosphoribosyl-ATP pyrophosphohydrolase
MTAFSLSDLEELIAARASASVEHSYTAKLLASGRSYCARKMGEEAVETVIAAVEGDTDAIRNEAADLLFHLLVVLKASNVPLDEVMGELARRTAQSGLEEKAARPQS